MGYTYDTIYNQKSMTRNGMEAALPTAFTNPAIYNAANRLTSFNGSTVLHDENGNMLSAGSMSYVWNAKNQLIEVKEDSSTIATFTYDVMGRRIAKTINGTTTKYLYDGPDIVLEMNGDDVATAYYIHGPGIDNPLARVTLNSEGAVTGIRFYLADALGSIIALTDENGVVKTRYNYTPFGAVEATGESSDNPFMFTGREWDGATGLYYYRARYYSPILGRFISEDPIGLAGGINMYAYTSDSPVNFTDPWGLDWVSGYGVELSAIIWNKGGKAGLTHVDYHKKKISADYTYGSKKAYGLEAGVSAYGMVAYKNDIKDSCDYTGDFTEATITIGPLSFSYFWNEGLNPFGKGWHGITWGVGLGLPVGASKAPTYTEKKNDDTYTGY